MAIQAVVDGNVFDKNRARAKKVAIRPNKRAAIRHRKKIITNFVA